MDADAAGVTKDFDDLSGRPFRCQRRGVDSDLGSFRSLIR
jgi:hypothetical protein